MKLNPKVYKIYDVSEIYYDFYKTNEEILKKYPKINNLFKKIEENRVLMNGYGIFTGAKNVKIPDFLLILKENLATEIQRNAVPSANYYLSIGNIEFYNKMKFHKSTIQRLRPEMMYKTADDVVSFLTSHLEELSGLGISAKTIKKIKDAKKEYEDFMKAPDMLEKTQWGVVHQLYKLSKENIGIIKYELKSEMNQLKNTDKKLFDLYIDLPQLAKTLLY